MRWVSLTFSQSVVGKGRSVTTSMFAASNPAGVPLAALRTLVLGAILGACAATVQAQERAGIPAYVGSMACEGCHAAEYVQWQGSHHQLAWTQPSEANVLADFGNVAFEHRGETTSFVRKDGRFIVNTQGQDGVARDYEVSGVVGVAPLQQYIVETGPGRVQALDVVWDVERKRWYHLYPDQELRPGDGLHWTGPYKTWNARCAECHATGYEKNYDPRTRRYGSRQAEIGVGCEACHGPGEAHVAWARTPAAYDSDRWQGVNPQGLTIAFADDEAQGEIQQCAGCHARREPLSDGNPLPGTPFHDAYRVALLNAGLYHADGAIDDEVYVYGSFLQSKMHARGVRCSDCHDTHAARLKADGNGVCTQCHTSAGNSRFPSLRKADYDDPSHHFHEAGSPGSHCASCHMMERVYMAIDGRRDHSFRIPRPDLSEETGAPNTCTDCHTDRDAAWAAGEIARHFPDNRHRGAHFSQVFAKARSDAASQTDALIGLAHDTDLAPIVRASALNLLLPVVGADAAARTAELLDDPDPLVRAAAVSIQRGAQPTDQVQRLVPLLDDGVRTVRIAAAREMLSATRSMVHIPRRIGESMGAAMQEWREALLAKADFPETHIVIGGLALVTRDIRAAEAAFRQAIEFDPQLVDAWSMLVRLRAAMGDRDGAAATLDQALDKNPADPMLEGLRGQF